MTTKNFVKKRHYKQENTLYHLYRVFFCAMILVPMPRKKKESTPILDPTNNEPKQSMHKLFNQEVRLCKNCLTVLEVEQQHYCCRECEKEDTRRINCIFDKNNTYKPKYGTLKFLKEYIEWAEKKNQIIYLKGKSSYTEVSKVHVPSASSFAMYIGVTQQVIQKWKDEHGKFKEILDLLKEYQYMWLEDNYANNRVSKTFASLMLRLYHDIEDNAEKQTNVYTAGFIAEVYKYADMIQQQQQLPVREAEVVTKKDHGRPKQKSS